MAVNRIVNFLQAKSPPRAGGANLSPLSANGRKRLLGQVLACNGGNKGWRGWKAAAVTSLMEMTDKSPRMSLMGLDLRGELNVIYRIEMPVPRTPVDGELQIGTEAVFHLRYAEEWRSGSPEGWLPLGLMHPQDPFHPNARPSLRGAICLGDLPPGIPPTEIVLLGYYTLSLQDLMLDEADPNGVLNAKACDYFRENSRYIPLTDAGLYEPLDS
ncbi:MAG: hypothetical protein U9N87_05635 [Planctomycetota bacterium]|nr:hypothetical protein [Planctomycetota bacterium]